MRSVQASRMRVAKARFVALHQVIIERYRAFFRRGRRSRLGGGGRFGRHSARGFRRHRRGTWFRGGCGRGSRGRRSGRGHRGVAAGFSGAGFPGTAGFTGVSLAGVLEGADGASGLSAWGGTGGCFSSGSLVISRAESPAHTIDAGGQTQILVSNTRRKTASTASPRNLRTIARFVGAKKIPAAERCRDNRALCRAHREAKVKPTPTRALPFGTARHSPRSGYLETRTCWQGRTAATAGNPPRCVENSTAQGNRKIVSTSKITNRMAMI